MSELIAEARVLVTPDTTTFRALLVSQLATATQGLTVPVTVTPVAANATSASRELATSRSALAATERELAGASAASAAASTKKTEAARLEAQASRQLAVAQEQVLGTTTALGTAQTQAARAAAALATARRAEEALTRADTAETAQNTVATLQNAEAMNTQAAAAVRAAKSQATHAAAMAQTSKGAASAALSFVGLRGATLAAGGTFLAGAAGVIAFGKALQSAAQFQTSLNVFAATAGATADEMQRVSDVSKDLGRDLTLPGVTANSAAEALSGLARAGLSVQQSIAGVRGVLQLATAAAISNEDAVNIVAGALNAFSLNGAKAAQVADLLAASSKESQGSITDVGLALQQSAAAAAQAGVSVQDTIALLTELGRAGLRGSDAGTSLRVALLRLIAPSKQAKEALDGLGVAIRDEQGNVRPEAFAEITKALQGFTKAQQDATLALIFGQDAFRAASIIGREGATGLNEMRDATQEVGAAGELAAARTQGLAGSVENLKNQLSTFGLAVGQELSGPLGDFVDIVAGGIGNINSFIGFLDRLGNDSAPRAERSISDLADEFARLNKEAGGEGSQAAATKRVEDLGRPAAAAVLDYKDLVNELGTLSFALDALKKQGSSLETPGAKKLAADIDKLKQSLLDTEPAGLAAASGVEEFRSGITATSIALERLKNSISQPEGFLPKQPTVAATGPKPIGPTAKLDFAVQVAQSNDDLQETLRLQNIQLANARRAFEASKGNVEQRTALFKAMGDAQAAVNATRREIASRAAADAARTAAENKVAAQKAQQAREQQFLFAQEDARTAQQRLVSRAQDTPALRDDIQRQRQLQALLTQQIAAVKKSVLDEVSKQAALRDLRNARNQTIDEIQRLRATDQKQRQEQAAQAAEALASARLELAQTTFDLTGQKAPLERALDAEIKRQIAIKNAAKKGSLAFIQAQTEIRRLLKQRKDLNEEITKEDSDNSPSLVDLFNKAEQIARGAGNVGGQNAFNVRAQPRIQAEVQQRLDIVSNPVAAAQARQERSTENLIVAIDRLTAVLTGNTASGTPITRREQNQWRNLTQEQRFFYQRQARQMVEQGLVG